jgi:hypothetical protein
VPDQRLDPPEVRADRFLPGDDDYPDLRRVRDVRAAAQLLRVVADLHDAHEVPVLLAEDSHRADRPGEVEAGLVGARRIVGHHAVCELPGDVLDPSVAQRLEMVEVEAEPAGLDQRPGLRGVLAQPVAQHPVEDVRRGVCALRAPPPRRVDDRLDLVPDRDLATDDPDAVPRK